MKYKIGDIVYWEHNVLVYYYLIISTNSQHYTCKKYGLDNVNKNIFLIGADSLAHHLFDATYSPVKKYDGVDIIKQMKICDMKDVLEK